MNTFPRPARAPAPAPAPAQNLAAGPAVHRTGRREQRPTLWHSAERNTAAPTASDAASGWPLRQDGAIQRSPRAYILYWDSQ